MAVRCSPWKARDLSVTAPPLGSKPHSASTTAREGRVEGAAPSCSRVCLLVRSPLTELGDPCQGFGAEGNLWAEKAGETQWARDAYPPRELLTPRESHGGESGGSCQL